MADYQRLDSTRSYYLYCYLFGRLAISRNEKGEPNNLKTAQRVGEEDLRKKIIPAVLAGEATWNDTVSLKSRDARLTTGRIAEMLSTLRNALEEDYKRYEIDYSRVLTTNDILLALYHLLELAPDERKSLGLPSGDKLTLLKQTLLSLQTKDDSEDYESIFNAYKESVGLEFGISETILNNLDQVNDLIEDSVRDALSYLPTRSKRSKNRSDMPQAGTDDTIIELSRKAQREVRRLLVRSGNTQVFLVDNSTEHSFIRYYLQPAFIKKLSQTVVSNERLTAQLPVYLKQVTTVARGPLPFSDSSLGAYRFGSSYPELLNKKLQALDGQVEHSLTTDIPSPSDYELASQAVNKLTLGFYIKVDNDYESKTPGVFVMLASNNAEKKHPYRRVDFAYSSTGIGGTLSHMVKIINTTLITDIPCLDRFFPIAHDVVSTQHIVRDNVSSPIWAHSLVKLCQNKAVGEALYEYEGGASSYDDFSFGDPIGQGDFCGFDFFVAQAQSAVQARLQAILNTGVDPQAYVRQLCGKVERQMALKWAWQMVKYYPFSSMAMIGTIHEKILRPTFGESLSKMRSLLKTDANIYFDAFLSIAEALLDEGAYRAAYHNLKKLEVIEDYTRLRTRGSSDVGQNRCEVFSSQLVIRYLLCKAIYYYLYDLDGPIAEHIQREFSSQVVTREQLVQKSWEILTLAQDHVTARLKKYLVVGEVSQGTFSPHYKLLSRIYLLRARLLTFFPRMVPKSDDKVLPTENFVGNQRTVASVHWGKLYLLEKARLYIAAEGDGETYAYYAALQSCYYLAAAYTDPKKLVLKNKPKPDDVRKLDFEHCLMWAKRLRDHALLSYEKTGLQCYSAIKEKSGLPKKFDQYGRYSIEKLPAIFEDRGVQKNTESRDDDNFLTLDISLLAINKDVLPKLTANPPKKSIYLFGTNACHIFLARGLFMLCSDANEEFEENAPDELIDWDKKLMLAGRLFDLAWAIAEDGCSLDRDDSDRQRKTITRSFKGSAAAAQYTSREIDSVRDLYPRRVSEIADIGKIYSAACKVLRLYLLPESERAAMTSDIHKLFGMLHGEYRFKNKRLLKVLLRRQSRYNGHLERSLTKARQALENHMPSSTTLAAPSEMTNYRTHLMRELFATLLD